MAVLGALGLLLQTSTPDGPARSGQDQQVFAASTLEDIINAPRHGYWDDQFDAKASRAAAAILSNNPIFGVGAAAN